MHGLNLYDYSARYYEPALGRFTSVDPHAESYYSWSPYCYVGNNPMKRTDPTGMDWEDAEEAYRLKLKINDRRSALRDDMEGLQAEIDGGDLSEDDLKSKSQTMRGYKLMDKLLGISLNDIDELGADKNHVYAFSRVDGNGEHRVREGGSLEKNKVYIQASNDGFAIHEIRHIGQSLANGGLEFNSSGNLLNASSNNERIRADNEVEAYQAQYALDRSFSGQTNGYGVLGINIHSVGNLRKIDGSFVYPNINKIASAERKIYKSVRQKVPYYHR